MIKESKKADGGLDIHYEFDVPVEDVYKAWTDPEQVTLWMGPGEVSCEEVSIDLEIGGKYQISMKTPDGVETAYGEYREIVPNEKLVFTWHWLNGTFTNSIVSLSFAASGEGTALHLSHRLIPDPAKAESHHQGWEGCLAALESFLASHVSPEAL